MTDTALTLAVLCAYALLSAAWESGAAWLCARRVAACYRAVRA